MKYPCHMIFKTACAKPIIPCDFSCCLQVTPPLILFFNMLITYYYFTLHFFYIYLF